MSNLIEQRVEAARRGENPTVIGRLPSGWLVVGDRQVLGGYCLLLADPVVSSLNALGETERARYCLDMIRVGDALLQVTGAARINYETWCNQEPALHTHITPRYADEPDDKRTTTPDRAYGHEPARAFDPERDAVFIRRMKKALSAN